MRGRQDNARQRSGRNPVLLCWVLVAAAGMALAGCGNLSLNDVLRNESPGEFRLSPEIVNLEVGRTFTFSAAGGFTPYNYQVVSGLGDVAKDQTWVYEAPKDPITDSPYYLEVLIQATDHLGDSDTATVRVFNPFNIVGYSWRIVQIPGSITIEATGGVPSLGGVPDLANGGYSWSVNGTEVYTDKTSYPYAPQPDEVGINEVGVTDYLGNYLEVMVIVLPQVGAVLTIYPDTAAVEVGGKVQFEAYGGQPTYNWSADAGTFTRIIGTPVNYTAPATPGTYTVTLTDSATPSVSVSATVTVTSGSIPALVLSPESPQVTAVGDQVQFSVPPDNGVPRGVPPYTFTCTPARNGSIDPATGLYTQLAAGKDVKVTVTDSAGSTDHTFVRWAGP
jgi:hypothetical protein